jgi:hypothetical protein
MEIEDLLENLFPTQLNKMFRGEFSRELKNLRFNQFLPTFNSCANFRKHLQKCW